MLFSAGVKLIFFITDSVGDVLDNMSEIFKVFVLKASYILSSFRDQHIRGMLEINSQEEVSLYKA